MSFPVASKQGEIVVGGKTADVIISHFGTHIFLCLSHYHKIGNLILVTKETVFSSNSPHTYALRTLLGSDNNEMLHVLARAIAELVYKTLPAATPPSLLLALALQEISPSHVKETIAALDQFGVQPNSSNVFMQ